MEFSGLYEDDGGWWRYSLTLENGEVIESGEYFHRQNAADDLKYVRSSPEQTTQFIQDFSDYFKDICPICNRPADDTMSAHHLVPKCKKGKETVSIHRVCHDFIHATFTDKELAREYNTVDKLMADERMQKFAKWVAKKVANYTNSSIMSNRKNPNKRK